MSVLRIQVHAMKTQNVPTVKVLTAVLVNRDSPEVELFVKVNIHESFRSNVKTSQVE